MSDLHKAEAHSVANMILRLQAEALYKARERLEYSQWTQAGKLIRETRGRFITTGMGKSGLVARRIAANFTSTGRPAHFLHPADARHGDLGVVDQKLDTLIVVSKSGETGEVVELLELLRFSDVPVLSILGNLRGAISDLSDVVLDASVTTEGEGWLPTVTSGVAAAMGDALVIMSAHWRGFELEDYRKLHPAGLEAEKGPSGRCVYCAPAGTPVGSVGFGPCSPECERKAQWEKQKDCEHASSIPVEGRGHVCAECGFHLTGD
jgi:arabinose-5-phosphate isomerase